MKTMTASQNPSNFKICKGYINQKGKKGNLVENLLEQFC